MSLSKAMLLDAASIIKFLRAAGIAGKFADLADPNGQTAMSNGICGPSYVTLRHGTAR